MSWSIKLFKVKGIDIKIHLTFFLILIWAAFRWSGSTGAGLQGALFGVVATLLLFAAVTLHELGHSFQALKFGVKVKDITLMPLGGLAQMEEIPENSKQELRIAIAGPLVNFAIAALLVAVGAILQTQSVISLSELSASLGQASWSGL
ncbi:MAG: M50 family metallopeptidase, partial [Anaerolineaceae bacterium]|nr:M50 family metallopeptidase [Anaerolineaceae bacterium]